MPKMPVKTPATRNSAEEPTVLRLADPASANTPLTRYLAARMQEAAAPVGVAKVVAPANSPLAARLTALNGLLGKVQAVPPQWLTQAASEPTGVNDPLDLQPIPCDDYEELRAAWRKAKHWTDGLDRALSCMLAAVLSTRLQGDQLWVKVLGPASSGKTTLCEALSVNSLYVVAKSTFRGFHSGFGDGKTDYSLISEILNMTFVVKDGDTLLQAPNLGQILSEGRDLYDTVSRSSYRTKAGKDHKNIRMTWILCGTSSLRSIDSSELGERFLDCVIMEGIDNEEEDEILDRVAFKTANGLATEVGEDGGTNYDPDTAYAMQLTAGYITYLRENASAIMKTVKLSKESLHLCTRFGKFVAFMRARPSTKQEETAERELAARLVSQHTRLMGCTAAVLNKKEADAEVIRRVKQVCHDTSRGRTLEIVNELYQHEHGMESKALTLKTNARNEAEIRSLLRFMRQIGIVNLVDVKGRNARMVKKHWRLTPYFRKLYDTVSQAGSATSEYEYN